MLFGARSGARRSCARWPSRAPSAAGRRPGAGRPCRDARRTGPDPRASPPGARRGTPPGSVRIGGRPAWRVRREVLAGTAVLDLDAVSEQQPVVARLERNPARRRRARRPAWPPRATVTTVHGQSAALTQRGDSLVVLLRHQQGERESAQHPFGRAPPLAVLLADVEQLAGVRQVVWRRGRGRRRAARAPRPVRRAGCWCAAPGLSSSAGDTVASSFVVLLAGDRLGASGVEAPLRLGQARSFARRQPCASAAKSSAPVTASRPAAARAASNKVRAWLRLSDLSTCLAGKAFQLADSVPAGLRRAPRSAPHAARTGSAAAP